MSASFLGSLAAIAAAEAEPIAHLQAGGALIVPSDEPSLLPYLPKQGVRVLRVGPDRSSEVPDVAITEVEVGVRTRVVLRLRAGDRGLAVLVGRIAIAITVAVAGSSLGARGRSGRGD